MLRALAVSLLLALPLAAQPVPEFEKVLLPLTPGAIRGAGGTVWITQVVLSNLSDSPLWVLGYDLPGGCFAQCVPPPPIPPRATIYGRNVAFYQTRGSYLYVEKGRLGDLSVALRIHEVSRPAFVTSVPAVRPEDLFATRFAIGDIPLGSTSRATLRIFDTEATLPGTVRVRVYGVDPRNDYPRGQSPDALLLDVTPSFFVPETSAPQFLPAVIEIPLTSEPALAGAERVRVEIEPLTGTARYWAFVSVTDNATQYVRVLTPQ